MARKSAEQSAVMGDEGARVKKRRERLGMTKVNLHEASGVDRATIAAIEDGKGFRMESLTKIERALDAAELEAGFTTPAVEVEGPGSQSTVEIQMPDGRRMIVSGPVSEPDKLADLVRRILRDND